MEIQRCDFFIGDKYDPSRHDLMTDSDRGRFVLYADHLAALEAELKVRQALSRQITVLETAAKEKDEEVRLYHKENSRIAEQLITLTAENAKYRKALEKIAGKCKDLDDYAPVSVEVGMIAQAALKQTKGGE
jgi:hypothetical protein